MLVVHVTNGATHDPRWWPPGVLDRFAYIRMREHEAERALRLVGARRLALGFDDQTTIFQLDAVITALATVLTEFRPDLIVSHAYEGGHPDHDAVALAISRARERVHSRAIALEMALYHGAHGELRACEFIERNSQLRYRLTPQERDRRQEMLAAYASQRRVLAPFVSVCEEQFRIAPAYDFARPPHAGPLYYERLGMKPSAEAWRHIACRELAAC